jgi:hypothetical protein
VFVRDLAAGTTTLVSRSTSGAAANQASYRPTLSGDGETVAFLSAANNLDPAFTVSPAQIHVYTRDLVTGTTHLADVSISGAAADGSASFGPQDSRPRLSHDGRYLVFASAAVDIVAGDTNGDEDVFNLDRTLGTIERVSLGACSQEQDAGSVKWPGVSDDGRFVVFASSALNMIASHITLFENFDVLVRNPTAPALGALVCAGTDSAPCPCGQPAPPTRGCPNSFTASGLCASGEARLSADTLRLGVYELPFINENQITCIFFQGTQALAGGMGVPFGDGVRCIGGRLVRLIAKPTDYFQGTFYPNLGEPSISIAGAISAPGTTRYYQLWYNDFSDTFCSESRFNFSNAVEVVWLP